MDKKLASGIFQSRNGAEAGMAVAYGIFFELAMATTLRQTCFLRRMSQPTMPDSTLVQSTWLRMTGLLLFLAVEAGRSLVKDVGCIKLLEAVWRL